MARNISVRMSDGSKVSVSIVPEQTIREVKCAIESLVSPPCPPELQRLIYKGRILKDTETVGECGEFS